ncbi:MAG: HAMP domain-containing histidine kinase [Cytophagales bacterium]|nr:HAMP domain-containing histidine kinase [Rhizobacter sp.]
MHDFLANNHDELIARCKAKVSLRPRRNATEDQLKNGVPLFLMQLTRTLVAEQHDESAESLRISGKSGGDAAALSEIGVGASAHGKALLALGFSVDQVVHDYGDLCQAITDLAHERDAPFAVEEFRTLNRCLDNAIADAVTEFSSQRDIITADRLSSEANERLGFLVHELRNSLQLANLSVRAMELGGLTLVGATGSVLKRSLASMRTLVDGSLAEVRANHAVPLPRTIFSLAAFVQDAGTSAQLEAETRGCVLVVAPVDLVLRVEANRDLLLGSLANLLSNAFKFTHRHTSVSLNAYALEDRIHIDVEDRCGGLPSGYAETMFTPFAQLGADKSGLGLGLSIARQNVESMGGTLTVRDVIEVGCVFTIGFPISTVDRRTDVSPDTPS